MQLVLITSLLAACKQPAPTDQGTTQKIFMRADSTAPYTEVTEQYAQSNRSGMGSAFLWYMAFRHLGGGLGYSNQNLNKQSVVGTNTAKNNAYNQSKRGGFGKTASNSHQSSGS